MKVIESNDGFFTVKNIQSVIYRNTDSITEWEMVVTFHGSNGGQAFRTYFKSHDAAKEAYEKILQAVTDED